MAAGLEAEPAVSVAACRMAAAGLAESVAAPAGPAACNAAPAAVDSVPAAVGLEPAAVGLEPAAVDSVPVAVGLEPVAVDLVGWGLVVVPVVAVADSAAVKPERAVLVADSPAHSPRADSPAEWNMVPRRWGRTARADWELDREQELEVLAFLALLRVFDPALKPTPVGPLAAWGYHGKQANLAD